MKGERKKYKKKEIRERNGKGKEEKRAERKVFGSRIDVCVQQLLHQKMMIIFISILSLQRFSLSPSSLFRNFILLQWIFTHQNLICFSFFPHPENRNSFFLHPENRNAIGKWWKQKWWIHLGDHWSWHSHLDLSTCPGHQAIVIIQVKLLITWSMSGKIFFLLFSISLSLPFYISLFLTKNPHF